MADHIKQGIDRDLASREEVRRQEIMAADRERMKTGAGNVIGKIITAALFIAAGWILLRCLFRS